MGLDEREFNTVVLAALLHDVGKFLQRGRNLPYPVTGRHPEVSSNFVGAFSHVFAGVADVDTLRLLVRHHHQGPRFQGIRPHDIEDARKRLLAYLVSTADHLSASERGEHSANYQDYHTTPLASVFQRLDRNTQVPSGEIACLLPVSLSAPENLRDEHFPRRFRQYAPGQLESLLQEFGSRWKAAAGSQDDLDALVGLLLDFLHRYTSYIASDTQEEFPDISLFDHLKTTAAIAACLYRYAETHGGLTEELVREQMDIKRFCLVAADLSGIQDYIFQITAGDSEGRGTARRLRARSLFIQALTDVLAHQLLHAFQLPLTNLVMSAGGKAYVLVPNIPDVSRRLRELEEKATRWLFDQLNAEVRANIAWVVFGDVGFSADPAKGWSRVMGHVTRKLAEVKAAPMRSALVAPDGSWDQEAPVLNVGFAGASACPSCHRRPVYGQSPDALCRWCEGDLQWGRRLPSARAMAYFRDSQVRGARNVLGYSVGLYQTVKDVPEGAYLITAINAPVEHRRGPTLVRFVANHVPVEVDGSPRPFQSIAETAQGRDLLAFVKADVDRLGALFAFGLGPSRNTLSRMSTLSRQLDLFFTAWVERRLKAEFQDCYTVFSGGDDLFLVGPWDQVLELVKQLREDFTRWVAHNPAVTFSAGVFVQDYRYPIARAAHEAEAALERAKAAGRDRIALLDKVFTWQEWQYLHDRWQKLRQWTGQGVPSAFLYSLLEYGRMWRRYRQEGASGALNLRFLPQLAYNVARNLDRRRHPQLYQWAHSLAELDLARLRAGGDLLRDLDHLETLAQLLIMGKEGVRE